jgi:glyceraldehyde-3-phosphate dehydrogenase (NAD(P))
MLKVGVLGCGTIGKRVADAVLLQRDLHLEGVVIRSPSPAAVAAAGRGIRLIAADTASAVSLAAAGLRIDGNLDELLRHVGVVVDCGQRGSGVLRRSLYADSHVAAVFCGGESRSEINAATFNATTNYNRVIAADAARVASCNTTALVRLLSAMAPFDAEFAHASIIKCATDPDKATKGQINSAVVDEGISHHRADLAELLPHIVTVTQSVSVPMTQGHVIQLAIRMRRRMPSVAVVRSALSAAPRVRVASVARSLAELRSAAARDGVRRGDVHEVVVFGRSLRTTGAWLTLTAGVHMESITIPEVIDCIRAVAMLEVQAATSMRRTDESLGIRNVATVYPGTDLSSRRQRLTEEAV